MGRTARALAGIFSVWLGMTAVAAVAPAQDTAGAAGTAADDGRVVGRVTRPDGTPLAGVQVSISALSLSSVTDSAGNYVLDPVPPGHYDVELRLGAASDLTSVDVGAGQEARLDRSPDWSTAFAETITVVSASRRAERITEAPAAVTLVPAEEIEKIAATGQVPKILEFTPGAEITQSGIYDFNFNTRGFNSSLNRRVAVLIDGREPSVPFLGAQEWASMPFPLDDLQEAELVRGPSAALYGANASSGVLNLITKRPRGSEGGLVRLTGGELSTFNGDLRWAGHLGGSWWGKVDGGIRKTGDFTVSRNGQAEYSVPCTVRGQTDCLPQEAVPLDPLNDDDVKFGLARLDRYWSDGSFTTLESGLTKIKGPVFQTGIGRVQVVDADRSWFRVDHSMKNWNFLLTENGRDAPKQTALATGNNVALDDKNWKGEIEGWWSFAGNRLRLVSGASYKDERIDSVDKSGPYRPSLLKRKNQQTLLFEPLQENFTAAYAQLDWVATDRFKVVVAGRYDDSTLHDPQISPKAALVFTLAPNHSIRLTYNEAFQVPNYSEYFLQADVAAPINLSPFETLCFEQGVSCGFNLDNNLATGDTRVLALGNENLKLEKVKTAEIGYTGVLGGRAMITADYYFSRNEDFITDLLPQLGTAFGRVNPAFGPYQTPRCKGSDGIEHPCLPPAVDALLISLLQQALGPQYALLSNNVDGTPILAAVSYTNFGRVDTQGLELGVNWQPATNWEVDFSYAYFKFDIKDSSPGLDGLLLPNSPENTASVALSYTGPRFGASAAYRWSDAFRWAVGPFQGDVPAYGLLDLQASFDFTRHFGLELNVSNALDEQHWEAFGGDLLGRRALGSLTFRW